MGSYMLNSLCVVFLILIQNVESARILGIFPMPSISHQVVFSKYAEEMTKHGHEIVMMTPNPALSANKTNITVIDVSIGYKFIEQIYKEGVHKQLGFKRGIIMDTDFVSAETMQLILKLFELEFTQPEVKKVLDNSTEHFDVIVVEAFIDYSLFVTKIFDAPVIQFSSLYGTTTNYATMGALRSHPLFYPNFERNKFENLSLYEKIYEVYLEWKLYRDYDLALDEMQNEMLRKQFGDDAPTLEELRENIDLLLLNSHALLDNNRPVPPNVIYLGGAFHLKPRQEIPEDLKQLLDNSTRGFIYVSLGTNVKTDYMDKELLDTFVNAFRTLPYDIIWKFDNDVLDGKPDNLHIRKWFPQRDLLFHPNIKLFIMQGGLQSTDEAIDAGVPLVVIPFMGDQFFNGHRIEQLGIGIKLMTQTMTTEDIVSAANEVLNDDSYRENVLKLKEVLRDSYQNPWEKAVWWTEYVIRHKGAKHLRASGYNKSWSAYLMIDVVIAVASLIAVATIIVALVVYLIVKCVQYSKAKNLEKKNK